MGSNCKVHTCQCYCFNSANESRCIRNSEASIQMKELILRDEEGESIPDFFKRIDMFVSNEIVACWSPDTIKLSWRKIIPTVSRESTLQATQTAENPTSATSSEPSATLTTSVDTTEEFEILVTQIGQNLSVAVCVNG